MAAASAMFKITSAVGAGAMAGFVSNKMPSELESVPGIGPANATKLKEAGVHNCFQLFGKFLSLYEEGRGIPAHMNAFTFWLKSVGITAYRNTIAEAVAEKAATWDNQLYRADLFVRVSE